MTRLGLHVSTRGGYREAAARAADAGLGAFQYFPKNPRSLRIKAFDRQDANDCAACCREHGIVSIAHGPYPINPATSGEEARRMAASTLNDLEIAEACGSHGVVVHFGVYKGPDPLQGYRNVIDWLNLVTAAWTGQAKVLLENQAGDHGAFGTTPEECVQIRSLCNHPERIAFCLDTCHLFVSGEWPPGNWPAFEQRARTLGYWNALAAIHLNDAVFAAGSRRDRHAAIGEGRIGEAAFRKLLATPELRAVPLVLETPAGSNESHLKQLALIRQWAEEANA